MQVHDLTVYLYQHIPLTQAMQVTVLSIEPTRLVLQAPLEPNINPHHTVFGGSVATMATLAAWCLLYTRLAHNEFPSDLVVRHSTMDYDKPIAGEFRAIATLEQPEQWEQQMELLAKRGKVKLAVTSVLECAGQVTGRFQGEFVALKAAQ